MEGPGSDEMERALHATFCAAANQLTQLYRMSLQQQRTAYLEGYQRALETVVRWTFQHIQVRFRFSEIMYVFQLSSFV
jgi:hypothetical protein